MDDVVEAAIKQACGLMSDFHLGPLDGRDIVFLLIAQTLIKKDPTPDERIQALGLLEGELYPAGCHWGSLSKALGGKPTPRPSRKRGNDKFTHATRDITIANTITLVCRDFGLRPTRSRATRDKDGPESACSIVTKALSRLGIYMSEDAVEKIWRQGSELIKISESGDAGAIRALLRLQPRVIGSK
jgi:hypothetical protein